MGHTKPKKFQGQISPQLAVISWKKPTFSEKKS